MIRTLLGTVALSMAVAGVAAQNEGMHKDDTLWRQHCQTDYFAAQVACFTSETSIWDGLNNTKPDFWGYATADGLNFGIGCEWKQQSNMRQGGYLTTTWGYEDQGRTCCHVAITKDGPPPKTYTPPHTFTTVCQKDHKTLNYPDNPL
ncbi:hypothetical protein BCV70DRAFT_201913 [Testicularia cyperi]|uniref:Uncharacterized protein n=1 Tax=Testicularia cyperi TaxID=1882483 RepID=A0A317XJV6_9BASI|nr:hypothetical protein BCV70DRAFT_201913 [Testicularia cyperi]